MSVTPKVYSFAPGAKTPAAIIDGVKRVMDYGGTHHWQVVTGSHAAGLNITLEDKLTGLRRLRLVAYTGGVIPTPTVECYYSHDGGVTESGKQFISGGPSGATYYALNNSVYGMSTSLAYVIETEDAITVTTAKGTDGGTSLVADALAMGVHAGRIGSAHNKSDSTSKIGEEGLLCGQLMVYGSSAWAMLPDFRASAQNSIWTGSTYSPVCYAVSGTAQTSWREKRDASALRLVQNVGDSKTIERLAPYPIIHQTAAGSPFAHVGYTRYLRARVYGHGDVGPSGPTISNTTVLQSAGDPNIGWRHNYGFASVNTAINTIHIWCPPGAEVAVP